MVETLGRNADPASEIAITGDEVVLEGQEGLFYTELFDRYANSEFGQYQASQGRRYVNRYAYQPEQMIRDLGDAVHPLRRMQYTEAELFRPLAFFQNLPGEVAVEQFSETDVAVGRLAALFHGIGECEHPDLAEARGSAVRGNYYRDKTPEDAAREARVRAYLFGALFPDIPDPILEDAEGVIANESNSLLSDAFEAAVHIGYFVTAITAGLKAVKIKPVLDAKLSGLDPKYKIRFLQLRDLGRDLSQAWYPRIVEHGERFVFASNVADLYHEDLEKIQTKLVGHHLLG